ISISKEVDAHRILLRWCPSSGLLLRTAGKFMRVFLRSVGAAVANVSDPPILQTVESPILVGYTVPANRPVQPGVHRCHVVRFESGVGGVPGGWSRQGQRKSGGVNLEKIDQIL